MPINYAQYQNQVANPIQQAMQNYAAVQQVQARQQQGAQAAQDMKAAQEMQTALVGLAENPNAGAEEYGQMITRFPQLAEQLKTGLSARTEGDQLAEQRHALNIYSALDVGDTDVARVLLERRAEAQKASGREDDAIGTDMMIRMLRIDPSAVKTMAGLTLSHAMGAEKFADTLSKLHKDRREQELQGAAKTKAQAEAQKAAISAKYAESQIVADLDKTGWDTRKIANDIDVSRQNMKIAAINAQLKREDNALKREDLTQKREDAQLARDTAIREKLAKVESNRANMDNFLNTADRIFAMGDDVIRDATGVYNRSNIGRAADYLDQNVRDLQKLVENLEAQAFVSQIPNIKGMGSLSDAEGKKLTAALQNFSLEQSPKQFTASLKEAQRLIMKGRQRLADEYGVPDSVPDTPAAAENYTQAQVDELVAKYGTGGGI